MSNNAQSHLNQIVKKERMFYLDLCNRNLEGEMDLSEFKNLKTLNASNNKFTNLDFLNSLPNKDQLSSQKLSLLVDMVENKKIKINTWKGTLTLDLLKALQELKANNNNNQNSHSQSNQRTLDTNYQSEIKPTKDHNNLLLIPVIATSVLVGSLFTYLWLKRSKKNIK